MAVEVLHGRDAGVTGVSVVEVVQPLALLQSQKLRGLKKIINIVAVNVTFSGFERVQRGVCALPPDAVLVGYGDAGVEGVKLDYGRNSGVSVDEYLIIQTGNACKEVQNKC